MHAVDIVIGEIYLTRIGANLGRVQVQAVHTDGKRYVVARPDRHLRTMLRTAKALHPVVRPGMPVRKDNRGGYRPGNPGGRPTYTSLGLEKRTHPITLKLTETEHAAVVRAFKDTTHDQPEAELSVWLRELVLEFTAV